MDVFPQRNGTIHQPAESPQGPVWKPDLWRLQEEAPKPRAIEASMELPFGALISYQGPEFHGPLSHMQAERLLQQDGDYLVRLSGQSILTLSFRFRGEVKHYRLYWNGWEHWVLEARRFGSLERLVADGLVTLHIESEAGTYISLMSDTVIYDKCPASRLTLRRNKDPVVKYDKPHAFKTHNFKGLNWCEFCGNFLWGFTAQGVKCQECGFAAHNSCGERVPADCRPELPRGVFGLDLTTLVRAHNTTRPFLVDKCIHEIELRGLRAEGLYRVSGFQEEMDSLRAAFDKDGKDADISASVYDNINVVAGILKLYFRLLPIPLVTYNAHPALIRAMQLPALREQLRATKEALALLPPAHYNTLKFLMAHLHRVEENEGWNKMSAQNLGTVFAPTLMPPPAPSKPGLIPDMTPDITALCLLIRHHKSLFV